jgi:hypothetical protein
MKGVKILIGTVIFLSLCFALFFFLGYFKYWQVLSKEKKLWMEQEFKPMRLIGIIYQLNKNHEGNCFTNFIVKRSNQEEDFASGICLCGHNKNFAEFASEGDSLIKNSNSLKITVIKKNSKESKEFDFPFCE